MEQKEIVGKRVQLRNKADNILHVTFRPCKPEDAELLIQCIQGEYGDTYFKRSFYEPEYLRQRMEDGSILFMVAETDERQIAGMLILKSFYPTESMCEIASQIFIKKYRGYHMAYPFFCYAMDILKKKSYSAAYCLPVVFHDITQRLLYRLGLRATGFILNVFDLSVIHHSYQNGRNVKHSQAVQIMPMGKRTIGKLYVPVEHQEMVEEIYRNLGILCEFADSDVQSESDAQFQSNVPAPKVLKKAIIWTNDEVQSNCEIMVKTVSDSLECEIKSIERRYLENDRQTFNVFLNMNDPQAVQGYHMLRKMGYFFTGIKPLCSENEYMILHNAKKIPIFGEDYILTEEFRRLWNYIQSHR